MEQLPVLEKKADRVLWCIMATAATGEDEHAICVELASWSTIQDIKNAPIKITGIGKIRKVRNHQLEITRLRSMESFFQK